MDPLVALICLVLLGVLVFILNLLSLIVIFSANKKNKPAQYTLLWLLTANVLIGLFPLPIYGLKKYNFASLEATSKICDAWRYTYFTTVHLAMISLVILTTEKVICLAFPFKSATLVTKARLNTTLALSWLFFICFDMIPFFPVTEHDDERCHYVVKKQWAVAMNIITMAIPMPFLVVTYGYMIYLSYKQAVCIRRNTPHTRSASKMDNFKLAIEIKATRKVTYIVGSYIICWLPSTIYYLLEWICPQCYSKNYEPHRKWIRFFFKLLVLFHAFVTPILFCWQSRIFRHDAKRFIMKVTNQEGKEQTSIFTISQLKRWEIKPNEEHVEQEKSTNLLDVRIKVDGKENTTDTKIETEGKDIELDCNS